MNRIELVFLEWPVTPSELHRNIVEATRREAAIEMPQSGNDHSGDRGADVGTGLIEDQKIEAFSLGKAYAGDHLFARVNMIALRSKMCIRDRPSPIPVAIR